jgi:hypothetical protein
MALHWTRLQARRGPTLPTGFLTTVRPGSRGTARTLLTSLATGYFLLVAVGLPVANTREALDAAVLAMPAPDAGVDRVGKGHPPRLNPDDDFSDAIPVSGLVIFAAEVPGLDLPRETPGALVGEANAPRPRPACTREDFERGPPSLT